MNQNATGEISADEMKKAIESGADLVILDVRSAEEVARSRIPGSIHLELGEIGRNVEKLLPDKFRTVYVYCLSGSRSLEAAREMVNLGYKNVYSLQNGLLSWRAKGFSLVQ